MLKVTASSDGDDILNLIGFIVASYLAIGLMFVVRIAGSHRQQSCSVLSKSLAGSNVCVHFEKLRGNDSPQRRNPTT